MLNFNQQKTFLEKLIKYSWRHFTPAGQAGTVKDLLINAYARNAVPGKTVEQINNIFNEHCTGFIFNFIVKYLLKLNGLSNSPDEDSELVVLEHFWKLSYESGINMVDAFTGSLPGTPLTSMDQAAILSARELYRVKNLYPLIRADDLDCNNDDLARALFLCGMFCNKEDDGTYGPIFSGMLEENQSYNRNKFRVHTCLHGFVDELTGDDPTNVYFIPYGCIPNDNNAFKVDKVYGSIVDAIIEKNAFSKETLNKNYCYRNSDYACVTINGTSVGNKKLKEVLEDRNNNNLLHKNNLFKTNFDFFNLTSLPSLSDNNDVNFNNFNHELSNDTLKYYTTIGAPGNKGLALDESGFAIAPSIDALNLPGQIQAMNSDYEYIIPQGLDHPVLAPAPTGRIADNSLSYPGMSGGPILMTIHNKVTNTRRCRLLGTVWGAERIFNSSAETTDIVSFTNNVLVLQRKAI